MRFSRLCIVRFTVTCEDIFHRASVYVTLYQRGRRDSPSPEERLPSKKAAYDCPFPPLTHADILVPRLG
jgi:hypothetical protein